MDDILKAIANSEAILGTIIGTVLGAILTLVVGFLIEFVKGLKGDIKIKIFSYLINEGNMNVDIQITNTKNFAVLVDNWSYNIKTTDGETYKKEEIRSTGDSTYIHANGSNNLFAITVPAQHAVFLNSYVITNEKIEKDNFKEIKVLCKNGRKKLSDKKN